MMNNPELLDMVELLLNLPDEGLQVGAQGTIVECCGEDVYEMEFVNGMGGDDRDGRFEFRTVCGGLAG